MPSTYYVKCPRCNEVLKKAVVQYIEIEEYDPDHQTKHTAQGFSFCCSNATCQAVLGIAFDDGSKFS
jgi:hypothetical protein